MHLALLFVTHPADIWYDPVFQLIINTVVIILGFFCIIWIYRISSEKGRGIIENMVNSIKIALMVIGAVIGVFLMRILENLFSLGLTPAIVIGSGLLGGLLVGTMLILLSRFMEKKKRIT